MVSKGKFSSVFFLLLFIFLVTLSYNLYAQESILLSYERNFIRASLRDKTDILLDAARDRNSSEFIGSLYEFALQYIISHSALLRDDPDMILLLATAARGTGTVHHRASIPSLLYLLDMFTDTHSRVEIIGVLSILGQGNSLVITSLNRFMENQNSSFRAGNNPDISVTRAAVTALGELGDNASFSVLFNTLTSAYPQAVIQDTLRALDSIGGNHRDFLINIIYSRPFTEKAAAFRIGAYNERLSSSERAEIALAALEVSLNAVLSPSSTEFQTAASLRYDAITLLTRLRWSPASNLAIRNFHTVQMDYAGGNAPRERLLEAIQCLGVMSTTEAAQTLALQLGLINSHLERTGDYDEAVLLALITALGELGDKAAFDSLLYISYLNYPDRIQASAREALNRLQW